MIQDNCQFNAMWHTRSVVTFLVLEASRRRHHCHDNGDIRIEYITHTITWLI